MNRDSCDIPVLMYHAVDGALCSGDPVYRLDKQQFAGHLSLLRDSGVVTTTVHGEVSEKVHPADRQRIVLSFDDGARCHAENVVPMLLEYGFTGEFFVNPGNVGKPDFVDWPMLRNMAAAGMSIQSHGYSHLYMDELDDRQLLDELSHAKYAIEDKLGTPVTVFAAPGGRVNSFVAAMAHWLGYKACCGSRPGFWRAPMTDEIIPRLAVRADTSQEQLKGWISVNRRRIASMRVRYESLRALKKLLGNGAYDAMRNRFLGADLRPRGKTETTTREGAE